MRKIYIVALALVAGALSSCAKTANVNQEAIDEWLYVVNEGEIIDMNLLDDEVWQEDGIWYLENPDRGIPKIPLSFDWLSRDEQVEFRYHKHLADSVSRLNWEDWERIDTLLNNPYGSGGQWGFTYRDGVFYVYRFDL